MSSPAEHPDPTAEALEWLARELRYESFLAALQGGGDRITPLAGRAGPARHTDTTDDARRTAAA